MLVNGQHVNIPSYTVRDGDTIELTAKAKDMVLVLNLPGPANVTSPIISKSITTA